MDSSQYNNVNRSMEYAKATIKRETLSKLATSAIGSTAGGFEFVAKSRDTSVEPNDSLYQLMPLPEHTVTSS